MQAPEPTCRVQAGAVHAAALPRLWLGALAVTLGLLLLSPQRALAAARIVRAARVVSGAQSISSNWSGYAVTSPGVSYTSATATWKQPAASCDAGDAGAQSAFWVGLGGYIESSQSLEQIGVDSDCSPSGHPEYYAWYELVPAAAVQLGIEIEPGNTVTVSVNALDGGTTIELQIIDRSRRVRVTKLVPFASADLSSAEWITEAPSECSPDACRTEPLADFGSVSFTRIAARGNGLGGTISDPSWFADQIDLRPGNSFRGYFPGPDRLDGAPDSAAGATAGALSAIGNAFTVDWVADMAPA